MFESVPLKLTMENVDYSYLQRGREDHLFITDKMKNDEYNNLVSKITKLSDYIDANHGVKVDSVNIKYKDDEYLLKLKFENRELDDVAIERIMDYDGVAGINLLSGFEISTLGAAIFTMDL